MDARVIECIELTAQANNLRYAVDNHWASLPGEDRLKIAQFVYNEIDIMESSKEAFTKGIMRLGMLRALNSEVASKYVKATKNLKIAVLDAIAKENATLVKDFDDAIAGIKGSNNHNKLELADTHKVA